MIALFIGLNVAFLAWGVMELVDNNNDNNDDDESSASSNDNLTQIGPTPDPIDPSVQGHVVTGAIEADSLTGGTGNDTINGLGGNDVIRGFDGDDSLLGSIGDDTIFSGIGDDTVYGGEGDDFLRSEAGANYMDGGDGNDFIRSRGDNSTLVGGSGNDELSAGLGTRDGGRYSLEDGSMNVTIDAGDGNDGAYGWLGNDLIQGGAGDDYIEGRAGNDTLLGGDGSDTIISGFDRLSLSDNVTSHPDILDGGAGDDSLVFGRYDTVTGGEGADHFKKIEQYSNDENVETRGLSTINDFNPSEDTLTIDLSARPLDLRISISKTITEDGVYVNVDGSPSVFLKGLEDFDLERLQFPRQFSYEERHWYDFNPETGYWE